MDTCPRLRTFHLEAERSGERWSFSLAMAVLSLLGDIKQQLLCKYLLENVISSSRDPIRAWRSRVMVTLLQLGQTAISRITFSWQTHVICWNLQLWLYRRDSICGVWINASKAKSEGELRGDYLYQSLLCIWMKTGIQKTCFNWLELIMTIILSRTYNWSNNSTKP